MTPQQILFIASVVFFAIAGISALAAAYVFFAKNVPDVRADLSGKKRARAVADAEQGRPGRERRRGVVRREPTTGGEHSVSGQLNTGDFSGGAPVPDRAKAAEEVAMPVSSSQAEQSSANWVTPERSAFTSPASIGGSIDDDADQTVLVHDDTEETSVLPAQASVDEQSSVDAGSGADSGSDAAQIAYAQPSAEASFDFKIVKKIVMNESVDLVSVG